MNTQWLLTYLGIGYVLGLSILGPALFSALLRDLQQQGKIHRLVRGALLILQLVLSLGALVLVIAFAVRNGQGLEHGDSYKLAMAIALFLAMSLAFASLAWLNTKAGKAWHGME